jgi:hypothetical protein
MLDIQIQLDDDGCDDDDNDDDDAVSYIRKLCAAKSDRQQKVLWCCNHTVFTGDLQSRIGTLANGDRG